MKDRIDPVTYLLRELSAEETQEAERLLREDDAFRAKVDGLRLVCERLEGLPGDAWEGSDPPPLDLKTITEANDPGERKGSRRAGWLTRMRPSLRPVALGATACGLLATGVGAGLVIGDDGSGTTAEVDAEVLTLNPIASLDPAPWGEVVVRGTGEDRTVSVVVGAMPPSAGDLYEIWLLDGSRGFLSLGSFGVPESGLADFEVPLPVDPEGYTYFDVSREPNDGNPAHSGESLLRGPT